MWPDAVRENGDGYQTVDYKVVSIELLRAVQELSSEVERLGDALARLEGSSSR